MKPRSLAKFAREQTRLRLKRVSIAVRRAAKHAQDPETAHDLRVAIRRFQECAEMFGGLFTKRSVEKMEKPMHKLMILCSHKRDYDVGIQVLENSGVNPQAFVALKFRETRDRETKALAQYLGRKKIRREADRWTQELHMDDQPSGEWLWSEGVRENVLRVLPPQVENFFDHGDASVVAHGGHKALHRFRLETKRLRYALEVFRPLYGFALKPKVAALRTLQDLLGAINDCVVVLALPEMDRTSARAVNRLLVKREAAVRLYWRETFPAKGRKQWISTVTPPRSPGGV